MRLQIKFFQSPDVEFETFEPPPNNEFMFLLELMVGSDQGQWYEQFQLLICSSEWMRKEAKENGPFFGRPYLVVDEYDFKEIEKYLVEYVSTIQGRDWVDAASQLGRVTLWESQDLNPNSTLN